MTDRSATRVYIPQEHRITAGESVDTDRGTLLRRLASSRWLRAQHAHHPVRGVQPSRSAAPAPHPAQLHRLPLLTHGRPGGQAALSSRALQSPDATHLRAVGANQCTHRRHRPAQTSSSRSSGLLASAGGDPGMSAASFPIIARRTAASSVRLPSVCPKWSIAVRRAVSRGCRAGRLKCSDGAGCARVW